MSNPIDLCSLSDVRDWLSILPGPVRSVAILAGGVGYTNVAIAVVPVDGNGTGCIVTGTLSGGVLVGLTIPPNGYGTGYTSAPALVITGDGTGAAAVSYLNGDRVLNRLITTSSQTFSTLCNRNNGFLAQSVTEIRNGRGSDRIALNWWPVLSVASVSVGGVAIPASISPSGFGWKVDTGTLYLVNGWFNRGIQNVVIVYSYGWPSIPEDVSQGVVELTEYKYNRRGRIDQVSATQGTGPGGQTTRYSEKAIPLSVQDVIDQYTIRMVGD